MNDPTPAPNRMLKVAAAAARVLLLVLLLAWGLLAVSGALLHVWIVPRIDAWRPALERQATAAMGLPVRIGAIDARPGGVFPSFELSEVVLSDAQGREALRLPRVVLALSPHSLWRLSFDQIVIEGAQLDIRRDADGRVLVAGLALDGGAGDPGPAADWLFGQPEIAVLGASVRWTDERRAAPPLQLQAVTLVLRNTARRHLIRLDATPPPEWGAPFGLRAQFRQPLLSGRPGDWRSWDGQLHADLPRVDVSTLRQHADIGVDLARGLGALRLWVDVRRGRPIGGAADLALREVRATLADGLQPLVLGAVSGRVAGRRLEGGLEVSVRALSFQTDDGVVWPPGDASLHWLDGSADSTGTRRTAPEGELKVARLDLGQLARIASRLPLGSTTHALLQEHRPQGEVRELRLSWHGPLDAPLRYEVHGQVAGLSVAARPSSRATDGSAVAGRPGIRGLSGQFDFNQDGGRARLGLDGGALELPGVFEDPVLPFDELRAELSWRIDGAGPRVELASLRFRNADLAGQARGSWRAADPQRSGSRSRYPGVVDLSGTLERARGDRVHRYLPLEIPADSRQYVRDAVLGGRIVGASFALRGDLWDFPFHKPGSGVFRVQAPFSDGRLAYVPRRLQPAGQPPWPAFEQLGGELLFEGNSLRVSGAMAAVAGAGGLRVVRADVFIADLDNTVIDARATLRGPAGDMLGVVAGSPLSALLGGTLDQASGSGAAEVAVRLTVPVADVNGTRVNGTLSLAGAELRFAPETPLLSRLRGSMTFSDSGFQLAGVSARLLGGDVRIEGGWRPVSGDGSPLALRATGSISAEGLRAARELPLLAQIGPHLQGSTTYALGVGWRRGMLEWTVSSDLLGMASRLPAPLAKRADEPMPLRYENLSLPPEGGGRPRDLVRLELARTGSWVMHRDLSGAAPRILRGALAVGLPAGEALPLPPRGMVASLRLSRLRLQDWSALRTSGGDAPAALLDSLDLQELVLRIGEFEADGRRLRNLVLGASREGPLWRAQVRADELEGRIEYLPAQGAGAGRIMARLTHLSVPASDAREVDRLLAEVPASVPALDIVVERFELRGLDLGRLEIEAVNRGSGASREWRLNRLKLTMPEAELSGQGNWALAGAQAAGAAAPVGPQAPRRTVLNFGLQIGDSGRLLERFGMPGVLRGGRGRIEGQLAWGGSPLALDYPTLGGQFSIGMEAGQFLKADPGIAKLLGVLSLQSLPRRLTLDFRDLFSEGFAFDFIRGDVRIERGEAFTNNLQMKGVNAAVLMEGSADIARETQDLRVVVVPEINAGTASLVATVINPAIGLGSFLAQMFLRRPLMEAATQEFRIDGSWTDPRVTRVDRRAAEAAPATAPSGTPTVTR